MPHSESGFFEASNDLAFEAREFAITNDDGSTVYQVQNADDTAWDAVKAASSGRIYLQDTAGDHVDQFDTAGGLVNNPVFCR